jgi:hypothetical protein
VLTAPAKEPLPPLAPRPAGGERAASIPDLSTPIAFTGVIGGAPAASAKKPIPPAPPPKPSSPGVQGPLESGDKITTLVSAIPDEIKSPSKPSEAKPGMTPIAPMKGTVKSESIEVELASAPATVVPTTQPSAAAPSIALDVTHRVEGAPAHLSTPPPPPAPKPLEPVPELKLVDLAQTPLPVSGPELKALEAPGSVAVWEPPPRKRLSGPMAMVLGIVIGALLFGLALLIMRGKLF